MICGKVPCLSQKMMIYYKMAMSGVYENVFQTSKNYLEGAKISFWNCKVWGGGPCSSFLLECFELVYFILSAWILQIYTP